MSSFRKLISTAVTSFLFVCLSGHFSSATEFIDRTLLGIFVRKAGGGFYAYQIDNFCEKSPCKVTYEEYEYLPTPHMACSWGDGFAQIQITAKAKGQINVDRMKTDDRFKCSFSAEILNSDTLQVNSSDCKVTTGGCSEESMIGSFQRLAEPSFKCAETYSSEPLSKLVDMSTVEQSLCLDPELADLDVKLAEAYKKMSSSQKANQKAWIKKRDKCGDDKSCLKSAYTKRLNGILAQ